MSTKVAFLSSVRIWIYVQCVVRTRLHAGLATNTAVAVEVNDSVVTPEQGGYGTNCYARSVFAVIAPENGEKSPSIRIFSFLNVLHPGAKRTERDFVFSLASNCARVAADAFAMIDYKAVFHQVMLGDYSRVIVL